MLFPRTDAGVAAQAVVVAVVYGALFWRVRHERDLRLLVAGLTVFTFGLFVLRGAH